MEKARRELRHAIDSEVRDVNETGDTDVASIRRFRRALLNEHSERSRYARALEADGKEVPSDLHWDEDRA